MPLKVAMPIIRAVGEGENYSSFYTTDTIPLFKFRLARKPRLEANEAHSSPFLDLVLPYSELPLDDELSEFITVYTMFPGIIEFIPDPSNTDIGQTKLSFLPNRPRDFRIPSRQGRLRSHFRNLDSDSFNTLRWLYHLNRSCLQLDHIVYENVTSESVRECIESLCRLLNSTDPCLTEADREFIREVRFRRGSRIIREFPSSPDDIRDFIDDFINGYSRIQIPAGIPVGRIAQQDGGDYSFNIKFFDSYGNFLNPIYFFRLMIKILVYRNEITVGRSTYTFLEVNGNWGLTQLMMEDERVFCSHHIHPLLYLLRTNEQTKDYLQYLDEPIGRYTLDGATVIEKYWRIFVPPDNALQKISDNDIVQYLVDYDRVDGVPATAIYEWRVDDYGFLVYRKKERQYPWDEEAYFTFDGDSLDRITDIYENITDRWFRGRSFNFDDIIGDYQIPSEILISNIAKESGGNPNACGIEYARDELRGIDCTNTDPAAGPLGYSDQYRRRFPTSRERAAASHPGAIGGGYSWTDLRHDLDSTRCTNYRVSPGLMQTLIADAKGIATGTTSRYIIGFPVRNSDILNWLFEPANAIPIGVIQLNNRRRRWSGYDPIKMRICHGAGSLRLTRSPSQFGYIGSGFINNGQIRNIYWAGYYNATIAFFNNYTGASPPVVRIATVTP